MAETQLLVLIDWAVAQVVVAQVVVAQVVVAQVSHNPDMMG
jgi:hypothetical protein